MKKAGKHLQRALSLVLVVCMTITFMPLTSFAEELQSPSIPVSAPLEQPDPHLSSKDKRKMVEMWRISSKKVYRGPKSQR